MVTIGQSMYDDEETFFLAQQIYILMQFNSIKKLSKLIHLKTRLLDWVSGRSQVFKITMIQRLSHFDRLYI